MATRKEQTDKPDEMPLTQLQAERLSAMTRLPVKELVGVRPADLADRVKWHIDPHLWGYRRVCGRVVKRDPVTGVD
jgi:hypothetical protein